MEGEIGDLIIRPCTPPAYVYQDYDRPTFRPWALPAYVYQDYSHPIFRRSALSIVAEKDEGEERGGDPRVSVDCRPVGVCYLIYQDCNGRPQEMLLSFRQERVFYRLVDDRHQRRRIQAQMVNYSNGAIDLRCGALVHVYDLHGAVCVYFLNTHQAAVIWGARDRHREWPYSRVELGTHRHQRPTLEQILAWRSITPNPVSTSGTLRSHSCGLPSLSIRRLVTKLQKTEQQAPEEKEESSLSTVWDNASSTYANLQDTFPTAGLQNNNLTDPVPRLSVRNLEGKNREPSSRFRDLVKLALRGDEDEVPEFHGSHNPTIVCGNRPVNANFQPSKKQRPRRKAKSFFKRSLRLMDLVRRKSRSAVNRVMTRRESAPPVVVPKTENVSEWVMDQPTPLQGDGIVALTEENLSRLRQEVGGDYQVVKPECDVPENSRASSVAGDVAKDKDGDDDEDQDEAKNENSDEHDEVHDKTKKDDNDDHQDGGHGGHGATQAGAAGDEPSTDNAQNEARDGANETTQDNIADKSAGNETIEDELTLLVRVLLLAHKRDPVTDTVPPTDFLGLMEAARKARLAEKFGPRLQVKRLRPARLIQLTQTIHTEKHDEGTFNSTKTSVPEQKVEKGAGEQVEGGTAPSTGKSHLHQTDNNEASLPFSPQGIPAAKEAFTIKLPEASRQQDEEAVRAIVDELKRGDEQCAKEHEIKDLSAVGPAFSGFYIAAPNPGQPMVQVQGNTSSWYNIPIIDPLVDSTVVLGREYEHRRCDTPLPEDFDSDGCIPLDMIPEDDLPVVINPPRAQAPAQALILHLLFKGHDIDHIAEALSRLDDEFLFKSESRYWKRVRVPQLWELNTPAVLEVLAVAQSEELWWEKTTDALGKEIPMSLQLMQTRLRANKVKQLARKSVENYLWWRFKGERIHEDIPKGHIIREFDN